MSFDWEKKNVSLIIIMKFVAGREFPSKFFLIYGEEELVNHGWFKDLVRQSLGTNFCVH